MITKLLPKREVKTKNGKTYFKRPKVQRLITPRRITRKRVIKKIKEDRRNYAKTQKEAYEKTLEQFRKTKKQEKKNKRKAKVAQKK